MKCGDYFCKTRRAWPCNPKVESLNLLFFFYFGIIYLLLHAIFKININWNVMVKAPAAWEGKRLQKMSEERCILQGAANEMNDLQSVVRRANCEWREGVQHGSLRHESGCKLCCKCGKKPPTFPQRGKAKMHATRYTTRVHFCCKFLLQEKTKMHEARTTMQASWKVGSRWTESGWNEWSWIVRNETK